MVAKRRDNSYIKRCRKCNRKPEALGHTQIVFICLFCGKATSAAPFNQSRKAWNALQLQIKEKEND